MKGNKHGGNTLGCQIGEIEGIKVMFLSYIIQNIVLKLRGL